MGASAIGAGESLFLIFASAGFDGRKSAGAAAMINTSVDGRAPSIAPFISSVDSKQYVDLLSLF